MSSSRFLKHDRRLALPARFLALALLPACLWCARYSYAQDQEAIDQRDTTSTHSVDDLKAQLGANSKKEKIQTLDQFNESDADLDKTNLKLQGQEAEILKKIKPLEASSGSTIKLPAIKSEAVGEKPLAEKSIGSIDNDDRAGFGITGNQDLSGRQQLELPERNSANSEISESNAAVTAALNTKVADSQAKIAALQRDLKQARDRLMISETEVERLSQLLEKRGMSGLVSTQQAAEKTAPIFQPAPRAMPIAPQVPPPQPVAIVSRVQPPEDLPVAMVAVEKANLRSGPGTENSAIMSVSKGTRLVIETRRGSWYRVFAPNGSRAWVTGDALVFNSNGDQGESSKALDGGDHIASTLRIRSFDAGADKESNRLLDHAVQ